MEADLALLLLGTGLAAGFVDAVAGGGGLLTVPVLLAVGLAPAQVLGTNKLQGSFGTLSASLHFLRRRELDLRLVGPALLLSGFGAGAGSLLVQHLDAGFLAALIPLLLIANALYFLFSPRVGEMASRRRLGVWGFAGVAGFGIGFYDGFFGPGTGSFFALAGVALLGLGLRRATAQAKLLNLTSNLAALLLFTFAGDVVWSLGLVMALGQVAGAWLGAHMVMRHGARLVRPLVVVVCLAVSLKLLLG